MKIIFDASTLILLAKVSILRMAAEGTEAMVVESAIKEVLVKQTDDARLIGQLLKEAVIQFSDEPAEKVREEFSRDFRLGRGEAASLLVARQQKWVLATDDGVAIKTCKIFGIPFVTAIHFLIHLRGKGKLDLNEALSKLKNLSHYGRYNAFIIKDAERRLKGEGGNQS